MDEIDLGRTNSAFQMEPSDNISKRLSQNDCKVSSPQNTSIEFEDLEPLVGNRKKIQDFRNKIFDVMTLRTGSLKRKSFILRVILALLFNAYFIWALCSSLPPKSEDSIDWCDGVGFFIIIAGFVYLFSCYYLILKPFVFSNKRIKQAYDRIYASLAEISWLSPVLYSTFLIVLIIFVVIDTWDDRKRLIPFFGIFVFVFLGFLVSKHPERVVWRHVIWGLGIQFVFGLAILRWSFGKNVFDCAGAKVSDFLAFTDQGSGFVFGYLVHSSPFNTNDEKNATVLQTMNEINGKFEPVFMFKVLSVIYFFSFFVSILFHLGIMHVVVTKVGWLLQISIGTTACESMNAAANIFLGQSEAPLVIRPYIPYMTPSEIHAVMTGGFATIAGSVLLSYIFFGISASHLLSASVMSAPAALASAKLLLPETKKSKTSADIMSNDFKVKGDGSNLLDSAAQGAITASSLVLNIVACIVSFLAFIGFLNSTLSWFGGLVGYPELTFELILAKMFIPFAWLMGADYKDLQEFGGLLGIKTFLTEFVAYKNLGESKTLSKRSRAIATYALCGFSNPLSIGIQIAGLTVLAPSRRKDISEVAVRAVVAGSMACFLTACVAGTLIS